MVEFKKVWKETMQDKNLLKAIVSLMVLNMIPLFGPLIYIGWMIDAIKSKSIPPVFSNAEERMLNGIKIAFSIILMLLAISIPMIIVALLNIYLFAVLLVFLLALSALVFPYFYPAALINFINHNYEFSSLFQFRHIYKIGNSAKYAYLYFILMINGIIASLFLYPYQRIMIYFAYASTAFAAAGSAWSLLSSALLGIVGILIFVLLSASNVFFNILRYRAISQHYREVMRN